MRPHFFRAGATYAREIAGVTDADLARFRAARGLRLPAEYVALLRERNGGFLRYSMFVDDEGGTHTLNALPGIGDAAEPYAGDLLKPTPFDDEEGRDITSSIISLYYEPYSHVALDYRACGPDGEPSVVSICRLKPTSISPVAATFCALIEGLQRDDKEFVLGFYDVYDPADLAQTLADKLRAKLESADHGDRGVWYRFHHLDWRESDTVWFVPNVDYAYHHEKGNKSRRAAGFDFPDYPECSWLLECDMATAKFAEVLDKLSDLQDRAVLVYQPDERDDDWMVEVRVAEPTWIARWLPKWLARCLHSFGLPRWTEPRPVARDEDGEIDEEDQMETHDCDGITVHWPRALGRCGTGRGASSDNAEENLYFLSGDHVHLRILKGRVSTKYLGTEKFFGNVKRGDSIEIVDENVLFVNGEQREGALAS